MSKYRHLNRENGEEFVNKSFEKSYFSSVRFFRTIHFFNSYRARNYSKLPDNLQYLADIAATEQVNMNQQGVKVKNIHTFLPVFFHGP